MEDTAIKTGITVYCHFSFKRPNKGADGIGLFAVAFYKDSEGKQLICHTTKKSPLWQNHQFITAIQSYENALRVISELQGAMKSNGISRVMLVTDNSTLAGWIEDPKKNKQYTPYMNKALSNYRCGSSKEILLDVGLAEVRQYEKSYKYCTERYVTESPNTKTQVNSNGKRVIDINSVQTGYKTVSDILKEESNMPTVDGMKEI